jgi:hypothetical protein
MESDQAFEEVREARDYIIRGLNSLASRSSVLNSDSAKKARQALVAAKRMLDEALGE